MADGEIESESVRLDRAYNMGRLEGLRRAESIVRAEAQRRDTTGQSLRHFLTAAIRAAADLIAAETERSSKNP